MRIAFVSLMYDAPWGGSEVLWAQTAARALAEGHTVFTSTYWWPEPAQQLRDLAAAGAQVYFRPRYQNSLPFRVKSWLSRLPRGGRLPEINALLSFRPDVVVISQGGWNDMLFHQQLCQALADRPFLLIAHNYHDPVRQNDEQRLRMVELYGRAKKVLFISELQRRALRRQLAVPIANACVVQNPLNLPASYPLPYPPLSPDTEVQLAVVGSFDVDRKGQDVLLETLASPEWRARSWHLNLYGKGPDQAYLQRLISFLGLDGRVGLHGHVHDSAAMWAATHLVVVPSRIESGPMVVQEALLCGRPVVAADVGLVRDWVEDDKNGFIADTASVVALNTTLERAWQRRSEWEVMGRYAAQKAAVQLPSDAVGDFMRYIDAAQ